MWGRCPLNKIKSLHTWWGRSCQLLLVLLFVSALHYWCVEYIGSFRSFKNTDKTSKQTIFLTTFTVGCWITIFIHCLFVWLTNWVSKLWSNFQTMTDHLSLCLADFSSRQFCKVWLMQMSQLRRPGEEAALAFCRCCRWLQMHTSVGWLLAVRSSSPWK